MVLCWFLCYTSITSLLPFRGYILSFFENSVNQLYQFLSNTILCTNLLYNLLANLFYNIFLSFTVRTSIFECLSFIYLRLFLFVDIGFLFCLILFFKVNYAQFSLKQNMLFSARQAFTSSTNMASSGVKKILFFAN